MRFPKSAICKIRAGAIRGRAASLSAASWKNSGNLFICMADPHHDAASPGSFASTHVRKIKIFLHVFPVSAAFFRSSEKECEEGSSEANEKTLTNTEPKGRASQNHKHPRWAESFSLHFPPLDNGWTDGWTGGWLSVSHPSALLEAFFPVPRIVCMWPASKGLRRVFFAAAPPSNPWEIFCRVHSQSGKKLQKFSVRTEFFYI